MNGFVLPGASGLGTGACTWRAAWCPEPREALRLPCPVWPWAAQGGTGRAGDPGWGPWAAHHLTASAGRPPGGPAVLGQMDRQRPFAGTARISIRHSVGTTSLALRSWEAWWVPQLERPPDGVGGRAGGLPAHPQTPPSLVFLKLLSPGSFCPWRATPRDARTPAESWPPSSSVAGFPWAQGLPGALGTGGTRGRGRSAAGAHLRGRVRVWNLLLQ